MDRAIEFWTNALHYRLRGNPDVDWAGLEPESGPGPRLSLMLVSSDGPRRHHMDIGAKDMDAEAERMIGLGATRVEWRYEHDDDYLVLADPDGNTFCIVPA